MTDTPIITRLREPADDWRPSEAMRNVLTQAIWAGPHPDIDAALIAVRPLIIAEEQQKWNDQICETYLLAIEWQKAHDKLLAGKPYEFPKPIPIPEIVAKIEAAERERVLDSVLKIISYEWEYLLRDELIEKVCALKDSKP